MDTRQPPSARILRAGTSGLRVPPQARSRLPCPGRPSPLPTRPRPTQWRLCDMNDLRFAIRQLRPPRGFSEERVADTMPREGVTDFLGLAVLKRAHSPTSQGGSPRTSDGSLPCAQTSDREHHPARACKCGRTSIETAVPRAGAPPRRTQPANRMGCRLPCPHGEATTAQAAKQGRSARVGNGRNAAARQRRTNAAAQCDVDRFLEGPLPSATHLPEPASHIGFQGDRCSRGPKPPHQRIAVNRCRLEHQYDRAITSWCGARQRRRPSPLHHWSPAPRYSR